MSSGSTFTSWRLVTARVHISLSPQELYTSPRSIATRIAFNSLFLKYTPELGGVAVAQVSPLSFSAPAHFIGASPYAHLVATAQLLVFAPSRGVQIVGKVTYVGPDHIGLSVFNVFHATLPIEPVKEFYAYENKISSGECVRKWRIVRNAVGFREDVTVGRQMRFVVDSIKASQSGLFQILASLNDALCNTNAEARLTLGVLPKEEEICMQLETANTLPLDGHSDQNGVMSEGKEEDTLPLRIMPLGKKSSASRARSALSALQTPVGDAGIFGDVLTPSLDVGGENVAKMGWLDGEKSSGERRSKKKEKKRKSVKFEDREREMKGEPQQLVTSMDAVAPVLTQAVEGTRDSTEKRARRKEKAERKRKKRENEILELEREKALRSGEKSKKKKKKRKSSQDGAKTAVEFLFGAGTNNSQAEEEETKKEESIGLLDGMGGPWDATKEEGLLVEEEKADTEDIGSNVRQNEAKILKGGQGDKRGGSRGSKDASPSATRSRAPEKSPLLKDDVKEEVELSVNEKEPTTSSPKRKTHVGKGTSRGEGSSERSRQKRVKRKMEKMLVDGGSEERKHKSKKRKKKHEKQLA